MIEDDDYRASSQYRYWSYNKQRLVDIRASTNEIAAEKVKAALRRSRAASEVTEASGALPLEIKTLSVDEELKIVQWHCTKIMEMGEAMNPRIPASIVATAIQYLRRFYLTNSPMTYNPKNIMMCALFLATKADHFYIPLHKFIADLPNVTEDDIKAPEFLLMQSLRFTLDVRHPMRGLEGGVAELQALSAEGKLSSIPKQGAKTRVLQAADKAKFLLRTAAQMTDVYFLYTPSQIWLAALRASDSELAAGYIDHIFSRLGPTGIPLKTKLMSTVQSCATILSSYSSPDEDPAAKKEMRRIGKKLTTCQNPEKMDIIAVARAKAAEKREGSESDAEKAAKKRKLAKERLQKDGDVFGPDLKSAA